MICIICNVITIKNDLRYTLPLNPQNRPTAEDVYSKINQWKTILESENLTDKEELDIKEKFIDADRIIKQTSLKSLSISQNKYCSALIDVPRIIERLKVSTKVSHSIPEVDISDY
ncbi:hypothetical protein C2G38_2221079 [Gigaspora rosea]|uniref:Uncharacterized protein n=1 Tax=Gigaspora rosea TaxID=44941 RepID=A0A397U415_9GLOM|nr:hypothetical protein C2G38_2221079 [Gigaspora rosea]